MPSVKEIVSPFLGGGAVELHLAAKGVRVHGFDNFAPLVNFWKHILSSSDALVDAIDRYQPLRDRYREVYKTYYDISDPFEQAVAFWVLNKSSFSGRTLAGIGRIGGGKPRYEKAHFELFRGFFAPSLSVECLDFRESLTKHAEMWAYCDPPYVGRERLYGEGKCYAFPHEALAEVLKNRSGDWILSYGDHPLIRSLYPEKDFFIAEPEWNYSVVTKGGQRTSSELLIMPK